MSQPWDYIAKLVCIGDSGTGKSSVSIAIDRTICPALMLGSNSSPFAYVKAAFLLLTMSLLELSSDRGLCQLDPRHRWN